jgi:hypothetical protein
VFIVQHRSNPRELHVIALSQFNSDRRGGGRFVVAVVAALAAAPAAFAADMPAQAPAYSKAPAPIAYDWTGFYLGAGVGARSSQVDGDVPQDSINRFNNFTGDGVCVPGGFFSSCSGESLNNTHSGSVPMSGIIISLRPSGSPASKAMWVSAATRQPLLAPFIPTPA